MRKLRVWLFGLTIGVFSCGLFAGNEATAAKGMHLYAFGQKIHLPWECGIHVKPSVITGQVDIHCDLPGHFSDLHIYFKKSSNCNIKEIKRQKESKDYQPYKELHNSTHDGIWQHEAEFHGLGKKENKAYSRIVSNKEVCMLIVSPVREAAKVATDVLWK